MADSRKVDKCGTVIYFVGADCQNVWVSRDFGAARSLSEKAQKYME
jgi:hypothetical protein